MKFLLINPWIYDFAAYDLWIQPIALFKLSTLLKSQGHSVDFINCLDRFDKYYSWQGRDVIYYVPTKYYCGKYHKQQINKPTILDFVPRKYYRYGLPIEIVEERLKKIKPPDYIFISSIMTYWYPAVKDMIELVRKYFPNSPIILGGIYSSIMPRHAKEVCKPDYLFQELSQQGRDVIYYVPTKKTLAENLNIDLCKLNSVRQDRSLLSNKKVHIMQTSCGCPFNCTYCASKNISDKFVQRDPEDVVFEMKESVLNTGTENFVFYDDALFVNKDRHIEQILKKWHQIGLTVNFHTPNGLHCKYIDKNLAELIYDANFKTIRLSLETSSPLLQKKSNKICNDEFKNAVNILNQAGFNKKDIDVYIMMAMPGQDEKQLRADILWAHNLGVRVLLSDYSPIPGTLDFEELAAQGLVSNDDDPLLHNNTIFAYKLGLDINKIREIRTWTVNLNKSIK